MSASRTPVILGRVIAGAGFAAILAITLTPSPASAPLAARTPITCLVCGAHGAIDVTLNVLLFVPLGFGLRLAGTPPRRALALAVVTTLGVETLQLGLIPGRDASLSDPLTNTAGAFLGILAARHWRGWLLPGPARSLHLALVAAAAWLAVWIGTASLVVPSLPRTMYWGQWAPELAHLARFEGTVLRAQLEGRELPKGRIDESPRLRDDLLDGRLLLTATAVAAGPTERLAPIVSVFDENEQEILLLGQDETDLVFRFRTRASDVRLRTPAVTLAGVLADAAGDTLALTAELAGSRYRLRAASRRVAAEVELAPGPGWGWALLTPLEDYAIGTGHRLLTALWTAGLLLPVGYWAGRARRRAAPLAAGLAAILGLTAAPLLHGLPVSHWSEWLAAAVGLAVGRLAGRWGSGGREVDEPAPAVGRPHAAA
ncbi:MAG TPA: VanZ family protein [Gemmatimonadales bacterium]|nr:VanZ family protein [Gemmatimonadales bacterium]